MAGSKRVLLASPRGYCAGVDRDHRAVEKALERFGAPVYVRKQIVHNIHVVTELEAQGAIFVDEVDEVPEVLVQEVLEELSGAGYRDVEQVRTAEEDLMFSLPKELRQDASGRRDGRALGGRARS